MALIQQFRTGQTGSGGLLFHQGSNFQRGAGILGTLSRFFARFLPTAKSVGKSLIKGTKTAVNSEIGRSLKESAINTATEGIADFVSGKKSGKEILDSGLQRARDEVSDALRESVKKRKNQNSSGKRNSKRQKAYNLLE